MCGWCFSKVKPHRKNGHHQAYPRLRSTFTQRQDMTGQTQQHCQRKFGSNFWATDECPWWALSLCPVACEYAVTPWKRANPFVLHVIIVALGVAQVGCVSAGAGLVDLEEPSTSAPDCSSWKRNKLRGIGNRSSFGRCGQKKTHETVAKSRLPKKIKQDAAREPKCSHVCLWHRCRNTWICSHAEHFSETIYLNSLVHFSPVTIPVHRRLRNMEEGCVLILECGV